MHKIDDIAFLKQIGAGDAQKLIAYFQEKIKPQYKEDIEMLKSKLVQLKDKISHFDGFVSLSDKDGGILKIKSITENKVLREEFEKIVQSWAEKHKIALEQFLDHKGRIVFKIKKNESTD